MFDGPRDEDQELTEADVRLGDMLDDGLIEDDESDDGDD